MAVSDFPITTLVLGPRALGKLGWRRSPRVVERNMIVYRRIWSVLISGFFEPVFYLLSIGIGLGKLTGAVDGVPYQDFVAPALLAVSAMNGAVYDSTMNIFWKIKYGRTYDAMLATPLRPGDIAVGEIAWALMRGLIYSSAFLIIMLLMGLVHSWWALLDLPVATLIGFAFAAAGLACTTWMRSWQDFDFVNLAILPMFLFSGAFYPLSVYNDTVRHLIEVLPLYHGIELMRSLTLGRVGWGLLGHVLYLVVLGLVASAIAARRLERLLLT
jgi:lipooligosaccharide transport system permease protein